MIQGDQEAHGHPQRPRQARQRRVQQVPVMFIKIDMTHVYMLFFKDKLIQNSPSMIQGDQEALGHPQRPRQGFPGP